MSQLYKDFKIKKPVKRYQARPIKVSYIPLTPKLNLSLASSRVSVSTDTGDLSSQLNFWLYQLSTYFQFSKLSFENFICNTLIYTSISAQCLCETRKSLFEELYNSYSTGVTVIVMNSFNTNNINYILNAIDSNSYEYSGKYDDWKEFKRNINKNRKFIRFVLLTNEEFGTSNCREKIFHMLMSQQRLKFLVIDNTYDLSNNQVDNGLKSFKEIYMNINVLYLNKENDRKIKEIFELLGSNLFCINKADFKRQN